MLTAFVAFTLQAAAPAPAPAPPPVPEDAISRTGQAWAACAKGRADAGLASAQPAGALADAAIAGCAAELAAIRAVIAAEHGAEAANINTEAVRSGTQQMLVAYIERERGAARPQ